MHTPDKKQQFIQLRVQGKTLGAIAEELEVSKTTLWRWNQEEEEQIRQLQLIQQEESEEEWHTYRMDRLTDLQVCSSFLHEAITRKISERADSMSLKDMFLYQNLLRSEMEHYRIKPFVRSKADEAATASEMVQNGTKSTQNGTPLPSDCSHASPGNVQDLQSSQVPPETGAQPPLPLPTEPNTIPQPKTEQNGTTFDQNGTTFPLECGHDFQSPQALRETASPSKTEQNGTSLTQNETPPVLQKECNLIAPTHPL